MRKMRKLAINGVLCRCKASTKFVILFIAGFLFIVSMFSSKYLNESHLINIKETVKNDFVVLNEVIKESDESLLENEDSFHEIIITKKQSKDDINEDKIFSKPISVAEKDFTTGFSKVITPSNTNMVLLIIACNRPSVGRCLDGIFKYKPSNVNIPVIVSQDCGDESTSKVISSYGNKLIHIKQPDLSEVQNIPSNMKIYQGYYKISRHYKWALTQVFEHHGADSVIIVEDDIDIAPDFFQYFLATRPLMERDPSIYCVSAWNDNGKEDTVDPQATDLLYRTDFFPGLGWLITKKIWKEMETKWPLGFWDDWLRAPLQRKNRVCIRPEISRTKTFGRIGVSQGQFFDQYLKYIKLNDNPFPFLDYDLSYLLKENYDNEFLLKVQSSPEKSIQEIISTTDEQEFARVIYNDNYEFVSMAKQLGIMSDLKAGVPRMAYKGIVSIYRNNKRVFLSPPLGWNGYQDE